MIEIIEVLHQEHRNIEKLLRVLERELGVFEHGGRPDYEVVLAVIEYFKEYPDSCHHPKEDIIVEKIKARDPAAAAIAVAPTFTLICFGFASSRFGMLSVSTPF